MEKNADFLTGTPLFRGISVADLDSLLRCLSARRRKYAKNETVLLAGDEARYVGVVLAGNVRITREDLLGNRAILAQAGPGELFAEAFSLAKAASMPVTVISAVESDVLLLEGSHLTGTCSRCCMFHARLVENMMTILAQKNMLLTEKMEVLTKRSTRDKLLAYLNGQANKAGSLTFDIPFNRQELADYLCVDRSAMSSELGRLQNEGVLTFVRNRFALCRAPAHADTP